MWESNIDEFMSHWVHVYTMACLLSTSLAKKIFYCFVL